jgi:hypothetical protein
MKNYCNQADPVGVDYKRNKRILLYPLKLINYSPFQNLRGVFLEGIRYSRQLHIIAHLMSSQITGLGWLKCL